MTVVPRNVLMGALVFLPVFLVIIPLEVWLHGAQQEADFLVHLGGALNLFMAFLLPVAAGAVAHSLALFAIPRAWPRARRRVTAVVLAPVLPATVLLIGGLGGASFIWTYFGATITATVVYGLSVRLPDSGNPNAGRFAATSEGSAT